MKNYCPFCDLDESYRFLLENETTRAIYPKNPALKFHVLLTPKRHIKQWDSMTFEEIQDIQKLLKVLCRHFGQTENLIGYNMLSNNGSPEVNQRVDHAHMHVFFRQNDDPDPFKSKHSATVQSFTKEQLALIMDLRNSLNNVDMKV